VLHNLKDRYYSGLIYVSARFCHQSHVWLRLNYACIIFCVYVSLLIFLWPLWKLSLW
jgi:hypothetical protein